jgi:5-methylcytosine-specific restriction endonuclease McrA
MDDDRADSSLSEQEQKNARDLHDAKHSIGMRGRSNVRQFIRHVDRICVEFGGFRPAEVEAMPFEKRHDIWLRYINYYNRAQSSKRRAAARASHTHYTQDDVQSLWSTLDRCCGYCGQSIDGEVWHVDHVIPLSLGGSNGPENITLACEQCNLSKGSKLLSEWRDRWYNLEQVDRP